MSIVAFVACVKTKADRPMKARALYTSPLFIGSRDYVERRTDHWFILSAKYGLLDPNTVIEPYEQSLNTMGSEDRFAWSGKVIAQIEKLGLSGRATALVLAGTNYRSNLMPFLHRRFAKVEVPMRQMPLGRQLQFLKDSARNPI